MFKKQAYSTPSKAHTRLRCPPARQNRVKKTVHKQLPSYTLHRQPTTPPCFNPPSRLFSSNITTQPTYRMAVSQFGQERSEYLKQCDARSIQYGIQVIFGDWDQDMIVVNKPFGLPMAALHRDNVTTRLKNIVAHDNVFPVHRLDKYTSGCLVVALKSTVAAVLQTSLAGHTLATVKTTEANYRHKFNSKEVKRQLIAQVKKDIYTNLPNSPVSTQDDQEQSGQQQQEQDTEQQQEQPKHPRSADALWSKRYRVMCQISPCVSTALNDFLTDRYKRNDIDINTINWDSDLSRDYIKFLAQQKAEIETDNKPSSSPSDDTSPEDNNNNSQHLIENIPILPESDTSLQPGAHSPDAIRSPHQKGTVYTPQYTAAHSHHNHSGISVSNNSNTNTNTNIKISTPPAPLLDHGYIHSHLIHRDFLPNAWLEGHDIVHVDHINKELHSRGENVLPIRIVDPRVDLTSQHGSELVITTQGDDDKKNDDTNDDDDDYDDDAASKTPIQQVTPQSILANAAKVDVSNLTAIERADNPLSRIPTQLLRTTRDATEYRTIRPGAPKPPDNDDENAEDDTDLDKEHAFNIDKLTSELLSDHNDNGEDIITTTSTSSASTTTDKVLEKKKRDRKLFGSLLSMDGMAIAPFAWVNGRIQLLEQVIKMFVMGKLESNQVKIVYKITPPSTKIKLHFQTARAEPSTMKTKGFMTFLDSTSDGSSTRAHTAAVHMFDKILNNAKKRWHPLHWTSHRVLINPTGASSPTHIIDNTGRPLYQRQRQQQHQQQSMASGDIMYQQSTASSDNNNNNNQSDDRNITTTATEKPVPALFPHELVCGCILPYATPMNTDAKVEFGQTASDTDTTTTTDNTTSPKRRPSTIIHNPHSLLLQPHLPPPPPHPFIPTGFLYESVPSDTERYKFLPTRNVVSLPKDIPEPIVQQLTNEENQIQCRKGKKGTRITQVQFKSDIHGNIARGTSQTTLIPRDNNNNNEQNNDDNSSTATNDNIQDGLIYTDNTHSMIDYTKYKDTTQDLYVALSAAQGKEATTLYKLSYLNPSKQIVIYNAKLLSGRTHQLRIHFSDAGLPIHGDPYYNPYFIKHWLAAYTQTYYHRTLSQQALRSIYIRPMFGQHHSGVTAQLLGYDNWKHMVTPTPQYNQHYQTVHNDTNDNDNDTTASHIKPSDILDAISCNEYNKTIHTGIIHDHSTKQYISSTLMEPNGRILPTDTEQFQHELHNLVDKPMESEMFLQSYMIEFPLPENMSIPRGIKKMRQRDINNANIKDLYDTLKPITDNNDNNTEYTSDSTQTDTPLLYGEKQSGRPNPVLQDGLPLYHQRRTPEEIEAIRRHKREEKNLYRIRKEEFMKFQQENIRNGTIDNNNSNGNNNNSSNDDDTNSTTTAVTSTVLTPVQQYAAQHCNITQVTDPQLKKSKVQESMSLRAIIKADGFSLVDQLQDSFDDQAQQYYNSPDDLDQYIHDPDMIHPDGHKDIQRLFNHELNPVWQSLQGPFNASVEKDSRPVTTLTNAPAQNSRSDESITIRHNDQDIQTMVSSVWHMSTQYRSWTYKTYDNITMVRIVLDIPQSWKHTM